MGYKEAIEDGIKTNGQDYCLNQYLIPCCECGQIVASWSYIRGRKYTCKECKKVQKNEIKEIKKPFKVEEQKRKLENAIDRIRRQGNNIDAYENANNKIVQYIENGRYFDSTEEIMAALQLAKCGIEFRHQVRMGKYKIDFLIPSMKVVLEIDGELFHTDDRKLHEQLRDGLIILNLGAEWEVIRIFDRYINQNTKKLIPAIKKGNVLAIGSKFLLTYCSFHDTIVL